MPLTRRQGLLASMEKFAGGANDGNDRPFESAFANLASAYIQDQAPNLFEYEVGFQLIDRSDDNTKAVGVFGFKIGPTWLYAPAFFVNGDLKGNELLYIKNQDQFVPLRDNWINYLLSKKPVSLGDGVDRDTRRLGVRQPDMAAIGSSPAKYASARRVRWAPGERAALEKEAAALPLDRLDPEARATLGRLPAWAKLACVVLGRAAREGAESPGLLPGVLASGGEKVARALHLQLTAYPALGRAFERFYSEGEIKEAVAKAAHTASCRAAARRRRRKRADAGPLDLHPNSRVQVFTLGPDLTIDALNKSAAAVLLDREEKARLMRDRYLIKDARADDEVSKAYAVPVRIQEEVTLTNPTETGLYELVVKPGAVERCLVVRGPVGPDTQHDFCTVVRVGEKSRRNWLNVHPSYLWSTGQVDNEEAARWLAGLPDAEGLEVSDAAVILLGPTGQGTVPFKVTGTLGSADGSQIYEVEFHDYCSKSRAVFPQDPIHHVDNEVTYNRWDEGTRVHLNMAAGSQLRHDGSDLYVPEGFKKFVCKAEAPREDEEESTGKPEADEAETGDDERGDKIEDKADFETADNGRPNDKGRSEALPILPGNWLDLELGLRARGEPLRIRARDARFQLGGGDARSRKEAMLDLVLGHGLREAAAAEALDAAAGLAHAPDPTFVCLVKRAEPYSGDPFLLDGGPYAPGIPEPEYGSSSAMGTGFPSQFPQEELLDVADLKGDPSARDAYDLQSGLEPDPQAVQLAQRAADTGQKEVFDTAMIGSLLKVTRNDSRDDQDIKDLMRAMDRIGRRMFKFYWNRDKYAERYGQDDMPELEDTLRSTFDSLGELCLFLKQRAIDPNPMDSDQAIDLADLGD